jgi:cytochrome c
MNNTAVAVALTLGLFFAVAAQAADGDATKGAAIYKAKCAMCHAPDQNKIGPKSAGVVGRKAGSLPDYTYSTALKASGQTWDVASLDKWLTGPSALVPGTKMAFKLPEAQDRADVIAYLGTLKAN